VNFARLGSAATTAIAYTVQPGDSANSICAALCNSGTNGTALLSYNSVTDDNGNPVDPNQSAPSPNGGWQAGMSLQIPAVWLSAAAAQSYGISGAGIAAGVPAITAGTGTTGSNALMYIGVAIVLMFLLKERKG
jgi:hypothetical protein